MHHRLAILVFLASACACAALRPPPPCPSTPLPYGLANIDHRCCDLEAHGFNEDNARGLAWLRAQQDTPEFYPLRCEWWQQEHYDNIGRKMCRSNCWSHPLRLAGVNYEPLHLSRVFLVLQRLNCTNNFANGGYWC